MRQRGYVTTLIALNAAIGATYLLQSGNREQSDAYHYARGVTGWLPWMSALRWWGVLFLAVALAVAVARNSVTGRRIAASFGLGVWVFWGTLLAASAVFDGRSGFIGPILFAAGAVRHLQVARAH